MKSLSLPKITTRLGWLRGKITGKNSYEDDIALGSKTKVDECPFHDERLTPDGGPDRASMKRLLGHRWGVTCYYFLKLASANSRSVRLNERLISLWMSFFAIGYTRIRYVQYTGHSPKRSFLRNGKKGGNIFYEKIAKKVSPDESPTASWKQP